MDKIRRLQSIDILRGITVAFMIIVNTPGSWEHIYSPLRHAEWNGCTPTDLVFPFFLFIVGLSMAYSLNVNMENDKSKILLKVLKRAFIIFTIGLALNWFPFYTKNIHDLRIFGVLQRIAVAFLFGSVLVIFIKEKYLMFISMLILIFYYIILVFGVSNDPLELTTNLVRKIDLLLLGESHLYKGYESEGQKIAFDPEGLLSSLGSIGNVMFGYIISMKLKQYKDEKKQIRVSTYFGTLLIILGLVWHYCGFPINKPIWSSSYALFTSGLCSILFAIMIYIIDCKKFDKWAFPFKVFGMNALISFALSGLLIKVFNLFKNENGNVLGIFYREVTSVVFGLKLGSLISALSYCFMIWLIAYILYRKNIFIKV